MKRLGTVLAGGRSTRFGSDKALAMLDGVRLLDRAVAGLLPSCDAVIVVGRQDPLHICTPDWPRPDCGPLGGLAGALRYAGVFGFDEVLSCGVDSVALPADLAERLTPAPAFVAAQPVVGLWPVGAVGALEAILLGPGSKSVRAFADMIGARAVALERDPHNINTAEELEKLRHRPG
ncbi:MAG TPA: molybdenum cofactor guanylyltransferase [Sphingobium sp.]|nr:molybdenum cofactor guanylyltransferase [Sphingobium sp.]